MIRAIKLIIDVKVSDFSEEWKLSIGALSAGVPFRDILLIMPFFTIDNKHKMYKRCLDHYVIYNPQVYRFDLMYH